MGKYFNGYQKVGLVVVAGLIFWAGIAMLKAVQIQEQQRAEIRTSK